MEKSFLLKMTALVAIATVGAQLIVRFAFPLPPATVIRGFGPGGPLGEQLKCAADADCVVRLKVEVDEDEVCTITPDYTGIHADYKQVVYWKITETKPANLDVKFHANHGIRIDRNRIKEYEGPKKYFYDDCKRSDQGKTYQCTRQDSDASSPERRPRAFSYTIHLIYDTDATDKKKPCFYDPIIVSRG